jgi:hypothetical protein
VNVAGGDERVDALLHRRGDRLAGPDDVGLARAREPADHRSPHLAGDEVDGLEIPVGTDGEAGFNDVDAEAGELMRHLQLLLDVHGRAGRLLAVAQRGVEDDDLVLHRSFLLSDGVGRRPVGLLSAAGSWVEGRSPKMKLAPERVS